MGVIAVEKGDLFKLFEDDKFDAIGHGCNCQNAMGAGIAPIFKGKYPQIGLADEHMYRKFAGQGLQAHRKMLGVVGISCEGGKLLLNMYTQFNPGKNGDYQAVAQAFFRTNRILGGRFPKGYKLGLPFIGCGIAGLDIRVVIAMANVYLTNGDVTFVMHPKDEGKFTFEGVTFSDSVFN